MISRSSLFLAFTLLAACAPAARVGAGPLPPQRASTAGIDVEDLRVRVAILAHDSMGGRETGLPGAGAAARYIAGELERLGLQPAGDNGGYLQSVPLRKSMVTARVVANVGGSLFSLGIDDLVPLSGIAGLHESVSGSDGGPLVFAGHIADPTIGADELTLDQLRGAVVILRLGLPAGVDSAQAVARPTLAALFAPSSAVKAVLLVAEGPEAELWEYASELARHGELALGLPDPLTPVGQPFFLISASAAERLLGAPLSTSRSPRLGLGTLEYTVSRSEGAVPAWNVVAILPGSDPARAGEYVSLGAHYDHVGTGEPIVDGDSIYNGADDNASGTSALLEVAEALAGSPAPQRPARSTLFVWHTAEESGLLGSEHFTDNPTVPREALIANINVDMVGRNHPDSLFVVGASRLSTELGRVVEDVNRRRTRPFLLDYSYDPEGHPEMIYCRSDHYNYARFGIPIVFLTSGLHEDYHQPSDEADKLNYEKLQRAAEYVRELVVALGTRPTRPTVDKPVPPPGSPCT